MKKRSTKRRQVVAETNPERHAYVQEAGLCQCCQKRPASDPHEIPRGSHREKALFERCAWLALCRECHEEMDSYAKWPIAKQLALKALRCDSYDRRRVNELRNRAPEAISESEVIRAAFEMGREGLH